MVLPASVPEMPSVKPNLSGYDHMPFRGAKAVKAALEAIGQDRSPDLWRVGVCASGLGRIQASVPGHLRLL